MCINPMKIPEVGFVACRECWQCRETRIDDWVGRSIAESKTAVATNVVTLTYGNDRTTGDIDHIRASVLTYSDVQKYFKSLRFDGYAMRYFVVGEYGSLKGRAHWHVVMFWLNKVPEHKIRENFMQKHWPHGWSYWDQSSPEAIRYACKYLLKDPEDPSNVGWGPMMSKKPPLGHAYFRQLADMHVQQGLSPQSLFYSFPEVVRVPAHTRGKTAADFMRRARPVRFHMSATTAKNYLEYFCKRWEEVYNDEPPRSDVVWAYKAKRLQEYLDANERPQFDAKSRGVMPTEPPFLGGVLQYCETRNVMFCDVGTTRLYYSTDSEGDAGWHEKIGPKLHNPLKLQKLLLAHGVKPLRATSSTLSGTSSGASPQVQPLSDTQKAILEHPRFSGHRFEQIQY